MRVKTAGIVSLIIISWFFSLISCQASPAETKLKVVASIFPLADFAKNIGKEKVEVITLLPTGANPHAYEPKPGQVKEIAKAKIFIKNGLGLEFWAEKIIKATANPNLIVVNASQGIIPIGDEPHQGANPHVWLDPILAQQQVKNIAQALIQVDPANKDFYEKNLVDYLAELVALDNQIKDVVRNFSIREFIAFHPAWTYFAQRYGLVEAAVIEVAPGREASPAHIKEVIDVAKKLKVKAIFAEPQFNPKAAQRIAEEAGIKVLFLDPLGGAQIKDKDSYLKLMKYNLEQMRQAMGK